MKKVLCFFALLIFSFSIYGREITTPEIEEKNKFFIHSPSDWGYRTFKGENGLIGALWPANTSFNLTETAIFVFLQTADEKLPEIADNINLFHEKCPGMDFKLFTPEKNNNIFSLNETYFSGRCGRTTVLFKETIGQYTLIFALISGNYITKKQFEDTKAIVKAYKDEVENYVKTNHNNQEQKKSEE